MGAYGMYMGQVVGPTDIFTTSDIVTGTLTAGDTEVTLNSPFIYKTSVLSAIIDEEFADFVPKLKTENGSVTLTFPEAKDVDITVGVRVIGTKEYQTNASSAIQKVATKTNALDTDVKALNSNLIANDGTQFRFGRNEEGEFGYIVKDESGADTVIPFRSGKGANNDVLDTLSSLPITNPSDTSASSSTKRTFVKNSIVVHIASDNAYNSGLGSLNSRNKNAVNIVQYSGFAIAFVTKCEPGGTYRFKWNGGANGIAIMSYKADGTFLGSATISDRDYTFTVADDAEYTLILPYLGNTSFDFKYVEEENMLYKNGTSNIVWDNGIYKYDSSSIIDGEATFNEANISMPSPNGASHCYTLISNKPIDLTEYSTLCLTFNGTSTISVDVSTVIGSFYIGIARTVSPRGYNEVNLMYSSAKEEFALSSPNIQSLNASSTAFINRVWLEK